VAAQWAAFLEGEAARAKTPDERAVFDSHRLGAYLELGQPERAIPMLEASERDLPDDYNPPSRLAVAYKAMGRWEEALAASDRALEKSYGPRQLGILSTRSEIYSGLGKNAEARETLEKALRIAEDLPPGQRSESRIASLKRKLQALP
jgi:tetratricopeptide (TPR) repeat protein